MPKSSAGWLMESEHPLLNSCSQIAPLEEQKKLTIHLLQNRTIPCVDNRIISARRRPILFRFDFPHG
jgi:hypothetical protein